MNKSFKGVKIMVTISALDKNGNRSFGLETELIPYAKLWESYIELDQLSGYLRHSPHKDMCKWVEDTEQSFQWLFGSREFFLFVIGAERYDVGCYDEELQVLSTLMHRFIDYLKVFIHYLSHGQYDRDIHVDTNLIKGLYDTISSYNNVMKSKWESHLSVVKKKKSK